MLRALLVAVALSAAPLRASNDDAPATHTFRQAPFNARGLASLEELRGKPVLVEFWGTR